MAAKEHYQNQGQRKNNSQNQRDNNAQRQKNNQSNSSGNSSNKGYTFINPYNFISIDSCRRNTVTDTGNLTGYMDCSLTTMTPLIMINPFNNEENNGHVRYKETFKINGNPAIPASSLRGMIRSKFETLTNSCMSTVDPQMPFVARSKITLGNSGLLHVKDGQAKLYWAKRYTTGELKEHQTGDIIRFNLSGRNSIETDENGKYYGVYRKGEEFNKKIHCFIYCLIDSNDFENAKILPLNSDKKIEVKCDDDVLQLYNNSAKFHRNNFEQLAGRTGKAADHASYCQTEWRPVWWRKNNFGSSKGNHIYLSLSSNGQLEYGNHLGDMLSIKGKTDYSPCNDHKKLCEACTVFGAIQDEWGNTSKVRFSDAVLNKNTKNYYEYIDLTLPILASPKYTNANFYMYSTDMIDNDLTSLSPDYKATNGGRVPRKYNRDPIHIRGRKEYWHFKPNLKDRMFNDSKSKQNVTVSPLKTDLVYSFKVYFENLTKEELTHLYMSICLANDDKHKYYHKLGMGKPLGFGSVKVDVLDIKVRSLSVNNGLIIRKMESYDKPKGGLLDSFTTLSRQQKEEIKCMYDFDYLNNKYQGVRVDYPKEGPGVHNKIFDWFKNNSNKPLPFANGNIIQSPSGKMAKKSKRKY